MMLVGSLFAKFDAFNVANRKPKTVQFYRGRLKRFVERFREREFASLTSLEIQSFLDETGQGLSDSTRRHNGVAIIIRLQSFAMHKNLLEQKVTGTLELPPQGMRERILTPEEITAILKQGTPQFNLILSALLASGARPGELCRAQIADLKDGGKVIELRDHKTIRRTRKPRRIMVGAKLREIIETAIGNRTEGPLFLSRHGRAWTPEGLSSTFRRIRNRLGLDRSVCLYLCRHTFATQAVATVGLDVASRLLGHSSLATTQRYTHPDEDHLRKLQDEIGDAA